MCLATPVKIESRVKNKELRVIVKGDKEVDISLIPKAKVGDYILVHGDLGIQILEKKQAHEILDLCHCAHTH